MQLDKIILIFLWNKKPVRVKRETIIAPVESGGLKMPEVFAFQEAQKNSLDEELTCREWQMLKPLSKNL